MQIKPEVSIIDLSRIPELIDGEKKRDEDSDLLRYINAIINNQTRSRFVNIGTQYFCMEANKIQGRLSDGSLIWRGFSSSTLVAESGLVMNLDLKHGVFIQEPLLNKVMKICRVKDIKMLRTKSNTISVENQRKLAMELKGFKIMTNCHKANTDLGSWKITEVLQPRETPQNVRFIPPRGQPITMDRHIYNKYGISLKYPFLPLVRVGDKDIKFPIECLDIMPTKKAQIMAKDRQKFIQNASVAADKRLKITSQMAGMKEYKSKQIAEFGFQVDNKPIELKARVLDPPRITTEDGSDIPIIDTKVCYDKFCQVPDDVGPFGIIVASNERELTDQILGIFEAKFATAFNEQYGKTAFEDNYLGQVNVYHLRNSFPREMQPKHIFEEAIKKLMLKSETHGKPLKWILPIVADFQQHVFYEDIKASCERKFEILSHCATSSTVAQIDASKAKKMVEKLNHKMGGINYRIHPKELWAPFELLSDTHSIVPGTLKVHLSI